MAKLNLDNFPQPKTGWSDGQKFALIALTIGLALLAWHLITKAIEAKKLAQAKMAESYEKLKVAEEEKAAKEKVVSAVLGQPTADLLNQITNKVVEENKNLPNTEGSTPL